MKLEIGLRALSHLRSSNLLLLLLFSTILGAQECGRGGEVRGSLGHFTIHVGVSSVLLEGTKIFDLATLVRGGGDEG